MASTKKKPTAQKKTATNRINKAPAKSSGTNKKARKFTLPSWRKVGAILAWPFVTMYRKLRANRADAPHKSFVRTRKRDKLKQPKIEGYIAFPWYVLRILWNRKWVYGRLILTLSAMTVILIGSLQVSNLTSANGVLDSLNSGGNVLGPVLRAAVTVGTSFTGALNSNLSDVQYIYVSVLVILGLLTAVWLLRHQLAGNKVKVRDGLYNSAGPIAAEYVLLGVGIVQIVPAAIAVLIYVTAAASNLIDGGIETALFSTALFLIVVLTLYFMTTTLFAMFIATIPGTYPMKAYKAARRIVSGQRLRLLLRLSWMLIIVLIASFLVLVPIVIITNSVGGSNSWVIPIAYQLAIITSLVYGTAYGYLLYRRMIDDPVVEK